MKMNTFKKKQTQLLTHGIVHAGFRGLQAFVARKKVWCKLIGNRFVIPHDNMYQSLAKNPVANGKILNPA